jgi:hypothetical protein
MADRSVSGLSTVKILEPHHLLISRYEAPKVAEKVPIFIYWAVHKV